MGCEAGGSSRLQHPPTIPVERHNFPLIHCTAPLAVLNTRAKSVASDWTHESKSAAVSLSWPRVKLCIGRVERLMSVGIQSIYSARQAAYPPPCVRQAKMFSQKALPPLPSRYKLFFSSLQWASTLAPLQWASTLAPGPNSFGLLDLHWRVPGATLAPGHVYFSFLGAPWRFPGAWARLLWRLVPFTFASWPCAGASLAPGPVYFGACSQLHASASAGKNS